MNKSLCSVLLKFRYFCTVTKQTKLIETEKRLIPIEKTKSKIDLTKLPPKTTIDAATVALLERLSLVACESKKAIETLEAKLKFADQILQVNTTNVEPLITPLEDFPLRLREDIVTEGNYRDDILKNASLVEDEYFVAPPGNIPLESRKDLLHDGSPKDFKNDSGSSS
ncbi:glutamyl-tRNA(Gln) amidotransferase subunit C, mitochondrial [Diorhabda sublineata]|uniref:glutamyl-tRNA(Gln) amidotransferase subunit C, mitochondrial n=1 Tax=Diorhabda sublineata TaxID=1163346 RepID=UPI0024E0A322|nr:glutamyl-tRNA(Gln) amidotransferase subunit C, mitochondrial [Diorhabda sublineata]